MTCNQPRDENDDTVLIIFHLPVRICYLSLRREYNSGDDK